MTREKGLAALDAESESETDTDSESESEPETVSGSESDSDSPCARRHNIKNSARLRRDQHDHFARVRGAI